MAEFCKKCFIEITPLSQSEFESIVVSDDKDYCERCGSYDKYVIHVDFDK